LTFARSWNGLAATRCLGKHGIYVITGDIDAVAAANFSRYSKEQFVYPDPNVDPDGFIDKLLSVAKAHAAADTDLVLMPLFTDIYPIICHKDRFEGIAKLALPLKEPYELVRSKARLATYCSELGIHIPPTTVVANSEEFYECARKTSYPAFVKIPTGSAAIGMCKVSSCEEAINAFCDMRLRYKIVDPDLLPIIQACVGGDDYCSTFLFDHGEYRASMTYHNLVDFPRDKGMGALRETVDARPLEDVGMKLLGKLGWNGVCEIDFRWDGVSEPWLIEVNPRFWGGLAQSIESGWKYPLWAYDLAVDGRIGPQKPEKIDVRTSNPGLMILRMIQDFVDARDSMPAIAQAYNEFNYEQKKKDIAAVLQLVKKVSGAIDLPGRLRAVVKLIKKERGAINEFFSWDDPLPILGLIYPLMIYIKHGVITPELLVGEKVLHKNDPVG
jgi:predicted ATP-grasp superfamily ATP-dependent carboligase